MWHSPMPDTVPVPVKVLADLVKIAEYVSLGRRAVDHQPGGAPYPDVTARFALGALSEAGLRPVARDEASRTLHGEGGAGGA